ncbi:IPT/TIG domain-containing protein [Pseudoalteromonas sp. B137]
MGASVTDSKIVAMAQVIYQYGPKVSEQVDILLAKDTLTPGDFELMMDEIVKELYNTELVPLFSTNPRFGPLTSKLMEAAEIDATGITQTLVNKAIAKLTPIYGQLKTAVEVSIVADLAIDIGKTIADLGFVAQKTDFSVTWGLNIADVQPRALVKGEQTYEVTVYGVGFNVSEGWIWDDYPVFTFVDSENSSHTFVSNEDDITVSDKGNKVVIILPGDFIDNTVGSLKLSVEHDDLNADSPYDIVVGEGIIISELTPDTGKPTDTITIVGSGFSSIPSENNVEFQGASGKIRANVVSVSSNQLTVKVPSGARTGAVTVSIDNIVSNELIFTIPYILEITYGDNGNFNDDIYKLKVNGDVVYDNNSPQRQIGPIEVPLSEGIHLVELEGIKADDGIATYYISFSGDVIDVTGDEMQGRDLCPQTTKSFNVNVGNAEENSNTKESLLLADQYVMIIQTEQSETQTECEVIE